MKQNHVRVIAGKWRSRKITFPNTEGLRPTPQRVRETLFNWLSFYLKEARCLDVFAGSGILGFEALSRGASYVIFVENNAEVITALQKNAESLKSEALEIIKKDALSWLAGEGASFDIVFLDPPYGSNLLPTLFTLLENKKWIHLNSFIYFESNRPLLKSILPSNWQLLKEKKAGQVYYYLTQKIS